MKYIIAVDGGGTKTEIAVLDLDGKLYYEEIGPGCNYVAIGKDKFSEVISELYLNVIKSLNIFPNEIELIYLGLSGADLESDFLRLNNTCAEIFKKVPFKIVNDAWLIMRSGLDKPYGAVAISGTGTNSAAINKDGKRAILRSLGFTLGIYGGGLDIAREALHYAFRADELTYRDTMLKEEIPKLLNLKEMNEVVELFYPVKRIDKVKFGEITGLVNKCAIKGDQVSIEILARNGKFVGLQTTGVIRQLKMENEKVPVVIGGRVFQSESPVFLNEFTKYLHEICPKADIVNSKYKPVFGAYLSALDELGIKQTINHTKNLK